MHLQCVPWFLGALLLPYPVLYCTTPNARVGMMETYSETGDFDYCNAVQVSQRSRSIISVMETVQVRLNCGGKDYEDRHQNIV